MSTPRNLHVLAINAGSSSIKFALYPLASPLTVLFQGAVSGIGSSASCFSVQGDLPEPIKRAFPIPERVTAVQVLVEWLHANIDASSLHCVSHRVVHGGAHLRVTQEITELVLTSLYRSSPASSVNTFE